MDNLLTELTDKEREAVVRAMEIMREAGLEVGLTKMYQSQAELAMMIQRPHPQPSLTKNDRDASRLPASREGSE
jgi:hypothetical protein